MKQRIKSYSLKFTKEIIPVIAGILIALFINNWYNESKDRAYIKQIFTTIKSELNESRQDLNLNLPRLDSFKDAINIHLENEEHRLLDLVVNNGGIYVASIKLNAWNAVSTSKIDLIDYNIINSLSNVVEQKEILTFKSNYLMNFLYANFHATDKETKEILLVLIDDIIWTEKEIIRIIDEIDY
ncbi:hypothetical protein MM239_10345 [Belliella sp. DSM 111904]|uniref:Nuclease-related domain-containing protein n=1 Tax=Belliella filtrata TaxID=2923435 RepID=A0ABS9V0N4_9BACT|nr:hypothetical protein [Belliella filtrata]MCH7409794.1 hypothetical protein [Belliella filtrata]